MPITADSFVSGHFDVLRRGLDAAQGKFDELESLAGRYKSLLIDRDKAWEKYSDAQAELLGDVPAPGAWSEALEKVRDLHRGLITAPELVTWFKEAFDQHYAGTRGDEDLVLPERPDDLDNEIEALEVE